MFGINGIAGIVGSITSAVGKTQERRQKALEAKAGVIQAEARYGSWLQRSWRPFLMLSITLILVNNYLIIPYLKFFGINAPVLVFPAEFWQLLYIGVGGYIGGRSAEKIFMKGIRNKIKNSDRKRARNKKNKKQKIRKP